MATFLNLFSGGGLLLSTMPGVLSWRLRFQKDDKLLSKAKRTHIESKIQDLAHKLNINKPIELIEKKGLICSAQAQGVAIFSGRAAIAIDPELAENMPAAELDFLLAHELSHIKANDLMWMGVIPGIVGVITTLAISVLFPTSATYFSPIVKAALMITSPSAAVGLSE